MTVNMPRAVSWAIMVLGLLSGLVADQAADRILGRWVFPTKGSEMTVFRLGDRYFARVSQVDQAGATNYGLVKDSVLIRDLHYDGQRWSQGYFVHPKTGLYLSVEVALTREQSLEVLVYKGIRLFHRRFVMVRKTS